MKDMYHAGCCIVNKLNKKGQMVALLGTTTALCSNECMDHRVLHVGGRTDCSSA